MNSEIKASINNSRIGATVTSKNNNKISSDSETVDETDKIIQTSQLRSQSTALAAQIGSLEGEKQVMEAMSNSLYTDVGDHEEFISIVTEKTVADGNARINEQVQAVNHKMFDEMELDTGLFNVDLDTGRALYTSERNHQDLSENNDLAENTFVYEEYIEESIAENPDLAEKAALEVYINSLGVEIQAMESKIEEFDNKVDNLEGTAGNAQILNNVTIKQDVNEELQLEHMQEVSEFEQGKTSGRGNEQDTLASGTPNTRIGEEIGEAIDTGDQGTIDQILELDEIDLKLPRKGFKD
ncbi:MAG: hypothetical protein HRT47_12065 [Candidatus Caenarcaniphilales bacterium]|nr:hypothetical protein [Candidatus Caenarcaniphilales bacterium]